MSLNPATARLRGARHEIVAEAQATGTVDSLKIEQTGNGSMNNPLQAAITGLPTVLTLRALLALDAHCLEVEET